MAHEIETRAWSGDVPWHGLGKKVNPDISIDEMTKEAGLDWYVTQQPMYRKLANGDFVQIKGRKALVRSSDQRLMTVTGDNWHPVQNQEALAFFRKYSFAGGAQLETAGSLKGGRTVWGLANLNKSFWVGSKKDVVNGYLLFTTSHQVGVSTRVRLTSVRVVCNNTLQFALSQNAIGVEYTQNHLREFDFDKAHSVINLSHERLDEMSEQTNKLTKLRMSPTETIRFLAPWFQPMGDGNVEHLMVPANQNKVFSTVLAAVEKAPGAQPGNAWGVLNGVTYWADHLAGRSTNARLNRAWFGDTARIKQGVFSELSKLAA